MKTKVPVQSYIDGMKVNNPPTIPRSKTGSNPFGEDESDANLYRRGSQLQIRLKDSESGSENEHENIRSIDAYGASIIDMSGDNPLSGTLKPMIHHPFEDLHMGATRGAPDLDMTQEHNHTILDASDSDFKSGSMKKIGNKV